MDVLRYKTVTGLDGTSNVTTGGLNRDQIIKVSRQGIQHDYVSYLLGSIGSREWAFFGYSRRVLFSTDFPFIGDEIIHIIYKEVI